jgi:hypothetical protein
MSQVFDIRDNGNIQLDVLPHAHASALTVVPTFSL